MIQNNKKGAIFQKSLLHIVAIICFLAVTFIYFSPILDGKSLPQGDIQQYQGMSKELRDYYYKDGQSSEWTGSMFSGMPSYQIAVWGGTPNFLDYVEAPLKFLGNETAGPVFTGMLMAYILFCVMGIGFIPALLGAIAYSLSSYNIIIIDAGHITKAWAIAYMPLVVSGLAAAMRRKYLLSGILMALGLALQIKSNHLQITYYTAILCIFIYIGLIFNFVRTKNTSGLLKSSGFLALGVILALLCNLGNIYANYEMSQESMRGKSELTKTNSSDNKTSSGLNKEYAFAWSYGKMETLSLLVPDIHGGASGGMLSTDSHLYKTIKAEAPEAQLDSKGIQAQTYWGEQPFTSGPVYFGAIICLLFVLGMILIKNPIKWILFTATIFFIFLSWGSNFETFNDWFFYHFPMYNKFRAVSTALVVPALTMLIIAIWGLNEFIEDIDKNKKRLKKALYLSGTITGGICLLLLIVPSLFGLDFKSTNDAAWISEYPQWFYDALLADRKDLLMADALRSLIFIILAIGTLFTAIKSKHKSKINLAFIVLLILAIIDLFGVDKRYLNNDKFQSKLTYNTQKLFPQSEADKAILQDKQLSYRVLNLNNPFNETRTSYYHKSIGGYHAAKLKRYQELIDNNLQGEIKSIIQSFQTNNIDSIMLGFADNTALNMLNTKYIIFSPDQPPLYNPYALGNAWFVENFKFADNADQELIALKTLNPQQTAIVDKKFESELSGLSIVNDSTAKIELIKYAPNELKYKSSAATEQLAVLSEIFYPKGWQAYIDGKPVSHLRADWTLRAIRVPAGQHEIEFKFVPHNYKTARVVASVSSAILILLVISALVSLFARKKNSI